VVRDPASQKPFEDYLILVIRLFLAIALRASIFNYEVIPSRYLALVLLAVFVYLTYHLASLY
jgi:hypothetical protein